MAFQAIVITAICVFSGIITYFVVFVWLSFPQLPFALLFFWGCLSARECNKCTHQHQLFSHLSSNPFRFKAIDMCISGSILLRMHRHAYTFMLQPSESIRASSQCTRRRRRRHTECALWKSLVQCNCAWINLFGESIKLPLWLDNSRFCQSKSEIWPEVWLRANYWPFYAINDTREYFTLPMHRQNRFILINFSQCTCTILSLIRSRSHQNSQMTHFTNADNIGNESSFAVSPRKYAILKRDFD